MLPKPLTRSQTREGAPVVEISASPRPGVTGPDHEAAAWELGPAALRAVVGAEMVWEDDREVWGVTGTVSGEALIRAAASVVDHLADRARAYLDSSG